jgi:hypothetical protein
VSCSWHFRDALPQFETRSAPEPPVVVDGAGIDRRGVLRRLAAARGRLRI